MKLFTAFAALTLIAAPVQATDYQKCEAINNAYTRIKIQAQKAGPENAGGFATWDDYHLAVAEAAKPYAPTIEKIKADYAAAGCY
jgi:hypothetical protein